MIHLHSIRLRSSKEEDAGVLWTHAYDSTTRWQILGCTRFSSTDHFQLPLATCYFQRWKGAKIAKWEIGAFFMSAYCKFSPLLIKVQININTVPSHGIIAIKCIDVLRRVTNQVQALWENSKSLSIGAISPKGVAKGLALPGHTMVCRLPQSWFHPHNIGPKVPL